MPLSLKNRQFGVQQPRNRFQIAAFQHLFFNMQLPFESSNMSSEITKISINSVIITIGFVPKLFVSRIIIFRILNFYFSNYGAKHPRNF